MKILRIHEIVHCKKYIIQKTEKIPVKYQELRFTHEFKKNPKKKTVTEIWQNQIEVYINNHSDIKYSSERSFSRNVLNISFQVFHIDCRAQYFTISLVYTISPSFVRLLTLGTSRKSPSLVFHKKVV